MTVATDSGPKYRDSDSEDSDLGLMTVVPNAIITQELPVCLPPRKKGALLLLEVLNASISGE